MLGYGVPQQGTAAFVLVWAALGVVVGATMLVAAARSLRLTSLSRTQAAVSVLVTAVAFALLAVRFGPSTALGPGTALAVVGPPLALVDIAERRLPSPLTLAGFVLGSGALILMATVSRDPGVLVLAALMAVAVGGCYLALAILSAGGLGAGDVKVAALTGLLLSPAGWWGVLVASAITWLSAAIAALALRAVRRGRLDETVPLGPFLVAGAMIGTLCITS